MWKKISCLPGSFKIVLFAWILCYGECLAQGAYVPGEDQDSSGRLTIVSREKTGMRFHVIPASTDTFYSEYPSALYKGGLIFISNRPVEKPVKRINASAPTGFDRLYFRVIGEDGVLLDPALYTLDISSSRIVHYGPSYFFSDDQKALVTLSVRQSKSEVALPRLFLMEKEGKRWILSDTLFKEHEGTFSQPFVDESTNRLYFVSDRAGGFGGADIYFCTLDDNPTVFKNAGHAINTAGDELFPFVNNDGFLYFSSTGHPGMGGMDLFRAPVDQKGFGKAMNLGREINDEKNQFAIIFDRYGRRGFFASELNGSTGSGIFHFYMVPQADD